MEKTIRFISTQEFAKENNIVRFHRTARRVSYTCRETGEVLSKECYWVTATFKNGTTQSYGCSFNFDPEKDVQVRICESEPYPITFVNNKRVIQDNWL